MVGDIHGFKVALVVGLPALGVTNIAVVGSTMVGAVLENAAGQGSGAGSNRRNCRSGVIVILGKPAGQPNAMQEEYQRQSLPRD